MESDNPTPSQTEDTKVHVGRDVNGHIAIGKDITQIGDVHDSEITIGQKITNFIFGSTEQQRAQRNRRAMLELVRNTWIRGVLEQSLHGAAMIELGMEYDPEAITRPWDIIVQTVQSRTPVPAGASIMDVFDDTNGALLILGEPGSGKTTTLLELARETIARAEEDPTQPIPVVFNLSSWAEKRQSIAEWLVEELGARYNIPKKVARPWVENDDLLLLLDGLDEVKQEHREACVKAVNDFRQEHMVPLVVCSRIADYEALSARLKLQGAVLLQPLTPQQIDRYLERVGDELAAVRDSLQQDVVLQELIQTPLMLSVVTLAYRGASADDLSSVVTVEARRRHVFAKYVAAMFSRRAREQPQSPEQTTHWLAWLAHQMSAHAQTIFLVEKLQPDWMPTYTPRQARRVVGLVGGLIVGLVSWLFFGSVLGLAGRLIGEVFGGLMVGLVVGLSVGLFSGLGGGQDLIETVETLKWSWRKMLKGVVIWLIVGLFLGLVGGLVFESVLVLVSGLVGGLGAGLVIGLSDGLSHTELETKTTPNQGIRQSAKNALIIGPLIGLATGLFFGLVFGLVVGLVSGLVVGLVGGLVVAVFFGLFLGLLVGVKHGSRAIILHFTLRYFLHQHDCLPWRVVPFLDYCTERIFLRKVGGGYIFVHRLLQEHFASLYEEGAA